MAIQFDHPDLYRPFPPRCSARTPIARSSQWSSLFKTAASIIDQARAADGTNATNRSCESHDVDLFFDDPQAINRRVITRRWSVKRTDLAYR